jgi:hypothetical protein
VPPGFAGLTPLRSGHHSSPGLKAWGFLEDFIKIKKVTDFLGLTATTIKKLRGEEEQD